MKKQLCKLALAFSLSSIAGLALAANPVGDAKKGDALVAVCAACHGPDGNSAAPNFPKLAGLGEVYLFNQLQAIQTKKRTISEMTGILDTYTDQQLADIAAFYNTKTIQLAGAQKMNVQVNSGAEVNALALAEKLYRSGNAESNTPACSGCHSPKGLGNEPAGYPRISGQNPAYIEKQLRDYRAGKRTTDGDAQIMRGVTQHLSDADIVALANYIGGLN
jgi:cytochrome c553